jgi:hypothetical protein
LNSKIKKNHKGSQIVHKNVMNLMVKTVSVFESGVKNYRGKTKKQKDGSACMRQVGVRGWLVGCEGDGGGHVAGWLARLTGASYRGCLAWLQS